LNKRCNKNSDGKIGFIEIDITNIWRHHGIKFESNNSDVSSIDRFWDKNLRWRSDEFD